MVSLLIMLLAKFVRLGCVEPVFGERDNRNMGLPSPRPSRDSITYISFMLCILLKSASPRNRGPRQGTVWDLAVAVMRR